MMQRACGGLLLCACTHACACARMCMPREQPWCWTQRDAPLLLRCQRVLLVVDVPPPMNMTLGSCCKRTEWVGREGGGGGEGGVPLFAHHFV